MPRPRSASGAGSLTVLDAQALVAGLTDEPARPEVEALLRDVEDPPAISAANLAEVVDVLVRKLGFPVAEVEHRLDWLVRSALDVLPVDEAIGLLAGTLRSRHYHRTTRPVSLADCVGLATAVVRAERLATSDPALAAMARAEGVQVVALPDSSGRRP